MATFADKPWRPVDHPKPGPSWRAADPDLVDRHEPTDAFRQGGGASSLALPPGLSSVRPFITAHSRIRS